MTPEQWDALRRRTFDEMITGLKLSGHSTLMLHGLTTPEGLPFVVVVAVDKNDRGLTQMMFDFSQRLSARATGHQRDNPAGWAELHRVSMLAKQELGERAPALDIVERMLELLGSVRPMDKSP